MPGTDLLIITALYLIQVGVLYYGLHRTKDQTTSTATPFVSVVIAARDEEESLPDCLTSLSRQTYPPEGFEIIVANDHSIDRTAAICDEYAKDHPNFSAFPTEDKPRLLGKPSALSQAIEKAKGEIILITDADCRVPATWIEFTARRYSPEVGLVGGMTLQLADGPFHGMQSLDWAYILGVASASAALGRPLGSIGNNLSFRKQAVRRGRRISEYQIQCDGGLHACPGYTPNEKMDILVPN